MNTTSTDNNNTMSKNRVCVIGAGTAGLCALKHSLEHGMDATAYEQGDEVGGTWVYTETTKNVPYDDEVHSSMYEGLRTNLPKEVMGFPDYPYSPNIKESFVKSEEVLNFLKSYAEHFNLREHIKTNHSVIRVRPKNDEWEVFVWDIKRDKYEMVFYDYVFVCNGHYTTPLFPRIKGMNDYKGKQLHSHLYRKSDMFKDAKVLVIGAGPSGMDIANHIHKVAKHVYLSHHRDPKPDTEFMESCTQKPDVERFTESGAIFKDGTKEDFSFLIYCTGYKYTFPFLSADCGVRVDDNFVQPLYKHCININYPSMVFIGLPFYVCPNQLFDLQVRFALKYFTNQKQFPSRAEMLADLEKDMKERFAKGLSKRQAHAMGEKQLDYYRDLAESAEIANIKPVIGKIMQDCSRKYIYQLATYRDAYFKVIDDENFVKFVPGKS